MCSRLLLALLFAVPLFAGDWPQFRGEGGNSIGEGHALPDKLDPARNLLWSLETPMGKSSPTIIGERLFLTAHDGEQLLTIAFNRNTGKELWRREITRDRVEYMHRLNDEATATPASDGERLFVFFDGYGMAAYSFDGEELWKVRMGPFTNFWGMGSSPVYADGKVIMNVDQDEDAHIVALNAQDGSIAWRTDRPDMVHGFSTPTVYEPEDGPVEVIVPGSYDMVSYNAADGKELWRFSGLTYQVKSTSVIDKDVLYFNSFSNDNEPSYSIALPPFAEVVAAYDKDGDQHLTNEELPEAWRPSFWPMNDLDDDRRLNEREWGFYQRRSRSISSTIAVRLGGRGDITESHLLWREERNLPNVPGVLVYQGVVYLVKDGGILTTLNAEDGSTFKLGRARDSIDMYYSSPVAGDDKVYLLSETGIVTVLAAGPQWEALSVTHLDDGAFATPALVDGRIYLRTNSRLYCFGEQQQTQ